MQPFENREDVIGILGVQANPVILHRNHPFGTRFPGRKVDARRLGAAILDRVPDEILQKLKQVRMIYQGRPAGDQSLRLRLNC